MTQRITPQDVESYEAVDQSVSEMSVDDTTYYIVGIMSARGVTGEVVENATKRAKRDSNTMEEIQSMGAGRTYSEGGREVIRPHAVQAVSEVLDGFEEEVVRRVASKITRSVYMDVRDISPPE